jgi:hypothetical protein
MATPMSAAFRAGASLTPSPVIATTWPSACRASTMRILCSGETRAKTRDPAFDQRGSPRLGQAIEFAPFVRLAGQAQFAAMAAAVSLWSPVIILTWMPACLAVAMAVSPRRAAGR